MLVSFFINDEYVSADVRPDMRLLDFLRTRGLKSVKCGCETTNCGLCTVWLDGTPVLSCAELMCRMNGRYVTTLEGLVDESAEFARCMAEEGAEQCGFCSPGLIMNVLALKRDRPDASDEQIRRALSGNLCRCTGYASQMRAVRRFLGRETVAAGTVAQAAVASVPAPGDALLDAAPITEEA
ncbi:(2Fe-2S)-binding protein [Parolsenella catena]|uniref:(2Fe-2S)-binding protein n=1 Tax=Parolsenella catena TaxID=2003188 RepID=UPI002FDB59AC